MQTRTKKVAGKNVTRMNNLFSYVRPERRKQVKSGFLTAVVIATLLAALIAWNVYAAMNTSFSDKYNTVTREGDFTIVVDGGTNVRTEPLAALHKIIHGLPEGYMNENFSVRSEGVNNVIGKVSDKNGTGVVFHVTHYVEVTESWWDDCENGDTWNGPYIGLVVSELSKDELKALPGRAKSDPDGIIWLSAKYLTIYQ